MELEEQEGFNNTHNYHSKPYKSSSTKKYHGERSPVYNLNVPLSEKNMFPFVNSFDKTKSYETQLEFMNALLRASHDTMEKFAETNGISILERTLRDSSRCLSSRIDLVDRILSYLNKINLTPDMLTRSRIHQALELIKACPDITEELSNKTFKLLIKWREVIKQWQEDDGESKALQYEIDQEAKRRASRSFIKRTNGHDRSSGSVSSEDGDRNNSRKPRERDNYKMSRGGGSRGRYDRGGFYASKNQNRRRPYDNDDYLDDDDDDVDKKNVKWIEDDNLVRFKYFRFNDEPSHRGLTEDEVTQIQEKLFDEKAGLAHLSSEDLKHQESRMENNSFKIKKDNEAEIQSKLNEMKEEIEYYRPKKLLIEENGVEYGKGSTEAVEHGNRIHNKLPCFYLKDKIPDQPNFENVRNTQKSTSTPAIIPLSNSTSEKGLEGEESQGIFDALEVFEQKGQMDQSIGIEKKPTEIQSTKMEIIQPEVKKPTQAVTPRKGILKKSRDQLLKEKEEARKLEEEKQKQKEKQKKGMSLDSELVMKLVNGEMTQEEQENLVNTLKESGDADGLLQNIATLKQFMSNVSHTKVKKGPKYGGPNPNANPYYGQEPKKMVKLASEHPQPNLVPPGRGPVEEEKQVSNYPSHFQEDHDDYRNQQGQGNQFDPMNRQKGGPRKAPFKPTNYKTVPCVWFHSPKGCPYGDSCNFIHDPNHAGRQTPNMHKYVRPLDQIDKNGPVPVGLPSPGQGLTPTPQNPNPNPNPNLNPNPNPRQQHPSQGFNPNMPKTTNAPPTSYYGFPDRNTSAGNMNIEKTPQVPYGSGPPNTFTRNPPSHNYMHSNQNANINTMPYNNRMGGGHHSSNYSNPHTHHGQQSNYGGYHSHPTPHGGPHGHQSHYNPQSHHMMMPPDQGGYRNDMMYQGGNPRMPPTGHHPMQMPMGYNPGMMPPKNVMPPAGGGYGMMDYNKGKE